MSTHTVPELDDAGRAHLGRRARLLAGFSVGYNTVEAVIAVAAGTVAGSSALLGFGLGSAIEVSSGLVILWQFRHALPASREVLATRLIGLSFLALAAFVAYDSTATLVAGDRPDVSRVGIGLAVASLMIMPLVSRAQRRTGRALHSASVVADSKQTLLCTYMSAVLLGGLVLNAALGWSWADPVAGLLIAGLAAKEGRAAWRGEGCCAPTSLAESDHFGPGCDDHH